MSAGRLITQTATHAARLVSEALDMAGARRYHYALLATLEEFGPSSQAELGRRCAIDRSYGREGPCRTGPGPR
ncbi:hypothetical protein [Nonomuraea sp. NPDC049784]|uniref:hypothetical protein n=1 Tax=Nonomuraea sp. NPDC049784 TaxID=3154361 RepID=UPI0033D43FB9